MRQATTPPLGAPAIFALDPPYRHFTAEAGPRPLGAVLVADARRAVQPLLDALLARRSTPWCPVCILAPDEDHGNLAATLAALEPEYAGCAVLAGDWSAPFPSPEDAIRAVHRRLPPTVMTLGAYVAGRIGPSADPIIMAACLSPAGGATLARWVSERTMSRQAAAIGPLAVRDWAGIGFVVSLFARRALVGTSVERAALDAGIDPRSVRRWFRLCTDREWCDAVRLAGWEWLLESALRKWGYIRGGGAADPRLAARVPLGARPFGVAISTQGQLYVARPDASALAAGAATDLAIDDAEDSAISVGAGPTDVAFSPGGTSAYVTNQLSGTVGLIDVAQRRQCAIVRLPAAPYKLFVFPDGSRVYVSTNRDSVFVIDGRAHRVAGRIEVGESPNGFALHPDQHRLYVSSWVGGSVSEVDVASNTVTRRFDLDGIPQGLGISADGRELYVANEAGHLDVLGLDSGQTLARITLAGGGFGLAITPGGAHAYVTLPHAGRLQVVHLPSRRVVKTLNTGGMPRRIDFDPRSAIAVVPNEGGWVDFIG